MKMDIERIFLDSSDVTEIKRFHEMGIIRGVTTNPTIMKKDGNTDIKKTIVEICELVNPYPVSVEVTTNDSQEAFEQAVEFSTWAENINIKITIHGPNGEPNLKLINDLSQQGIEVNVTAMMSVQQCYLAASAGASYVSLFGGRVNNMGYDSKKEIAKLRILLVEHDLPAKIIVGSVREQFNVMEWLENGAHIVTVPPHILEGMYVHPYTKETVQMFLKDAEALNE